MRYDSLEEFRRRLLSRRRALLQRRDQSLAEEEALLTEREPDWEDAAAAETAAAVLESLSESDRQALERIEASLAQIERGTYGQCASCGARIDERRLRTVPDADRCEGCAPTR